MNFILKTAILFMPFSPIHGEVSLNNFTFIQNILDGYMFMDVVDSDYVFTQMLKLQHVVESTCGFDIDYTKITDNLIKELDDKELCLTGNDISAILLSIEHARNTRFWSSDETNVVQHPTINKDLSLGVCLYFSGSFLSYLGVFNYKYLKEEGLNIVMEYIENGKEEESKNKGGNIRG